MDSANRSFFALVSAALVPYVLLGMFGCGVLSLASYRVAEHGLSGLDRNGQDLRPAVLFFAVVTAGTVVAAISVHRQIRATRALSSVLSRRKARTTEGLLTAAERSGLAGRVDLVDDPEPYSFTYGVLSSRVVVSRGLLDALEEEALDAVLHHEQYHVRNWDTLKLIVARAAPSAFFFLPALGHLRRRYLAGRELAADRRAMSEAGERPLVSALHHVLEQPAWSQFGGAAALGGAEFLELRITQLETGSEPPMDRVPRWAWVVTVAALVGLTGLMLVTVLSGSGDALTMMDGSERRMPGGTVLGVLGAVACSVGWVGLGWVVWRRVIGHNPLTRRSDRTTNQT